jgi:hypothetical protein
MRFFALLVALALPALVSAADAGYTLKTFNHTGGFANCVNPEHRYVVAEGDRSTVIAVADFEAVAISAFARHPQLAYAGVLPEQLIYLRKRGGEELLLFLVSKDGGAKCVFASIAVNSLSTAGLIREKYLK